MCRAMGTETELEIYDGPHKTDEHHHCMISGEHYHRPGIYDSFIRPPDDNQTFERAVFAGDECPVCELFGNDNIEGMEKPTLVALDQDGDRYTCPRGHIMTHNELSNLRAGSIHQSNLTKATIDHEWVSKVTVLLMDKNVHTAVLEIWKEIHR